MKRISYLLIVAITLLMIVAGRGSAKAPAGTIATTPTPSSIGSATPTPSPALGGRAFYVDPAGSDSNSGTSPTSPWSTIAKVNSASLQPGDVVFFKSGGIWRERLIPQNGAAGAPIIYAAYGSGTKPIISGADFVPDGGWSVTSGSIYQITLADAPARIWNLYVDGGVGAAAQNALGSDSMWGLLSAACVSSCSPAANTYIGEMRSGSWFYSNPTLYVWLGDGSSPLSHTVEIVTRDSAVGGTVNSGVAPSHIVLDDLNLQRAGEGVSFYAPGVASYGDIVMRNLTVLQTGTGQVDARYLNGLDLEGAVNATYDSNVISYTGAHGNGINNQRTDNAMFINNDVSHADLNGIAIKASDNVTIKNNKVHDGILGPTGSGLGPNVNNFHANGIYDESVSADGRSGSGPNGSYPAANLVVELNQISNIGIGGTAGTGIGIQLDDHLGGGNQILNNSLRQVQIGIGAFAGSGIIFNNVIDQTNDGAEELTNGGYTEDYDDLGLMIGGGAATIRGQTPGAHDFALDPLFNDLTVDPPDFSLKCSSPCIETGIDVGLPFTGAAPDIGAVDAICGAPTATASPTPNNTPTPTIAPTQTMAPTPTIAPTPTDTPTPTVVVTPTPSPTPTPGPVAFSNVFIVLEENHSFSDVVGNSTMPYFNNVLIANGSLAVNYYADSHPSLPNYLEMISGSVQGQTADVCPITFTTDNAVRELVNAGVSWKGYMEDLPSVGSLSCTSGDYVAKHDPFVYFSDVVNVPAQLNNVVPFTQFATDIANGTLPRYSFITPNLQDDAHDGTLNQADTWLQNNISPLLADPMFQPGGNAVLIVVFDEGNDNTHVGGQVAWVAVGPHIKPGYRSTTFYQHESTLRLMLKGLGVTTFPGTAATAPDMTEFFQ
jgi:hypothetical protein